MSDFTGQCLALAALVQSAVTVDANAHGLDVEPRHVTCLLNGIFVTDPESTEDIFGDGRDLDLGFESGATMLGRTEPALFAPTRYTLAMIDVERRLRTRDALVAALATGVADIGGDRATLNEDELCRRLSSLYQETISTLDRRIQVTGLPERLQQDVIAARIRALLLAGIRAAWLWRQLGGRRWHLVLQRSTIRRGLEAGLAHSRTTRH